MLVDTAHSKKFEMMEQKHEQRSNSYSFYWRYARLLRLNDSFKIPIDISNLKDSNLLLQKRIRDRDAKKADIGIN